MTAITTKPGLNLTTPTTVLYLTLSCHCPQRTVCTFVVCIPFDNAIACTLNNDNVLRLTGSTVFFPTLVKIVLFYHGAQRPLVVPPLVGKPLVILLILYKFALLIIGNNRRLITRNRVPVLIKILKLGILLNCLLLVAYVCCLLHSHRSICFLLQARIIMVLVYYKLNFVRFLVLLAKVYRNAINRKTSLFGTSLRTHYFIKNSLLCAPSRKRVHLPNAFGTP